MTNSNPSEKRNDEHFHHSEETIELIDFGKERYEILQYAEKLFQLIKEYLNGLPSKKAEVVRRRITDFLKTLVKEQGDKEVKLIVLHAFTKVEHSKEPTYTDLQKARLEQLLLLKTKRLSEANDKSRPKGPKNDILKSNKYLNSQFEQFQLYQYELRKKYLNKFVLFENGVIFLEGYSRVEVVKKAYDKYGIQTLFIEKVFPADQTRPVYNIPTHIRNNIPKHIRKKS